MTAEKRPSQSMLTQSLIPESPRSDLLDGEVRTRASRVVATCQLAHLRSQLQGWYTVNSQQTDNPRRPTDVQASAAGFDTSTDLPYSNQPRD